MSGDVGSPGLLVSSTLEDGIIVQVERQPDQFARMAHVEEKQAQPVNPKGTAIGG